MCGRYTLFSEEANQELREIIEEVNGQNNPEAIKMGEIFPTNIVPILMQGSDGIMPRGVKWGFPHFQGSGVIINARSETAEEKNMFRKSLYTRRCAVPTTGFYEWDRNKCKYRFVMPETRTIYLAGIYNLFEGEPRFLILTTAANDSISFVHNRMPVIIYRENLERWLGKVDEAIEMLKDPQPELEIAQ